MYATGGSLKPILDVISGSVRFYVDSSVLLVCTLRRTRSIFINSYRVIVVIVAFIRPTTYKRVVVIIASLIYVAIVGII